MHGTAPTAKNHPAQNANGAKAEKPWSHTRDQLEHPSVSWERNTDGHILTLVGPLPAGFPPGQASSAEPGGPCLPRSQTVTKKNCSHGSKCRLTFPDAFPMFLNGRLAPRTAVQGTTSCLGRAAGSHPGRAPLSFPTPTSK